MSEQKITFAQFKEELSKATEDLLAQYRSLGEVIRKIDSIDKDSCDPDEALAYIQVKMAKLQGAIESAVDGN